MSKKAKQPRVPRPESAIPARTGDTPHAPQAESKTAIAGRPAMDERQILLISKAIADPRRMSLMRMIASRNATCRDLRECLSISAATLSHHMKELETAGLIETSKDGRFLQATLHRKVWKSYLSALKDIGA